MHPQPQTKDLPLFLQVLFWLLSLGVRAGRAHDAVLPQEVPQDLILGLPVFHLRGRRLFNIDQSGLAPPATATPDTHLLPEQLVIDPEPVQGVDVFSQLQVALAELLDVFACFGQDPSFTLGEENVWMGGVLHSSPVNKAWTHLTRLGVINIAVRDGLGQLHDPVVDLISAPALDCRDRNPNVQRLFHHTAPPSPLSKGAPAHLRCAALAVSRLWNREEPPASWRSRRRRVGKFQGSLSTCSLSPEVNNYAM